VYSALGFYPVAPATDEYVIGAPLFKKVTMSLENGETITINAPGNSNKTPYIKGIKLNDKNYSKNYFKYSELMKGAVVDFEMDNKPNKERGTKDDDLPYSFSSEMK
jgi:putative alpha-1,2-mannosidase